MKTGILKLNGVFCGACSYAIEHNGRKQTGVKEVRVNVAEQTVTVIYEGDREVLKNIASFIDKIGHDCNIVTEDING